MPLPNPVLPMSIDEFHVMEHRLGWKYEYWDGAARLSPQSSAVVDFERPIGGSEVVRPQLATGYQLRGVELEDEPALVRLFTEVFEDSVEYSGWDVDYYYRDATDSIRSFFGTTTKERSRGRRRGCAGYSFVIACEDRTVAAICVRQLRRGPIVEPIMVARDHQRQGLGRALLYASLLALQHAGISKLYSRCHLGNAASLAWHEQNGFVEIPNYFAATHRQRHFAWLTRHRKHHGDSDRAADSQRLADHWDTVVKALEASSDRWGSRLLE